MSNWFYIRKWNSNKEESIGKEMTMQDAKFLFKSLKTHSEEDESLSFALLSKDNVGKVVADKGDIGDWKVLDKTKNFSANKKEDLE